jgi:hypothetical protein
VDLVVHNPFNSEVNISDLTLVVAGPTDSPDWNPDFVDGAVLYEIVLDPKETCTVSIVDLFDDVHTCNRHKQRFHRQYWQNDQ